MASWGHHEKLGGTEETEAPSERSFGLTFTGVFTVIALWLYWRKDLPLPAVAALTMAGVILLLALRAPTLLHPFNRLWFKFGLLLHKIVNPLVMGLLFFVVFTPTGYFMRMMGVDFLRLKPLPAGTSYWISIRDEKTVAGSMKDQF